MLRQDPTDWANKRKAAAERAKQLREERKRGVADEGDTFTPQINRRPSYLNNAVKPSGGDSLDMLAAQRDPNDPMEQPLPGARAQQQQQQQQQQMHQTPSQAPQYQVSGSNFRGAPSPGSDALGNEMKKFPPNKAGPAVRGGHRHDPPDDDAYVPYERNQPAAAAAAAAAGGNRNSSYNPAKEADDIFMSNLRSDGHGGPSRRAAGPGWNDDITTSGAFDAPKAGTGGARRLPQRQRPADSDAAPPNARTSQAPPRRANPNPLPEWSSDFDNMPVGGQKKLTPRSPRPGDTSSGPQLGIGIGIGLGGSDLTPPKMSKEVSAVRSRLSLLKSKMRRSESSGGARSSVGTGSSYEDPDENSSGYSSNAPKSAPQGRLRNSYAGPASKGTGGGGVAAGGGGGGYGNGYGHAEEEEDGYQPMSMMGSGIRAAPRGRADGGGGAAAGRRRPGDVPAQDNYVADSRPAPRQQQQPAAAAAGQSRMPPRHQGGAGRHAPYEEDVDEYRIPSARGTGNGSQPAGGGRSSSGAGAGAYPPASDPFAPGADEFGGGEQLECPDCGRKFNPGPYEKHIKICAKVFIQKRKAFDSTKMRIQAVAQDNPELIQMLTKKQKEEKAQAAREAKKMAAAAAAGGGPAPGRPAGGMGGGGGNGGGLGGGHGGGGRGRVADEQPVGGGGAVPKWKQQSKAFRESMRAAREVTKAIESGAPLPPAVMSAPDPSLVPCPHCGRRFNEKAAARHIPVCTSIQAKPTMLKRGVGGGGGVNGSVPTAKGKSSTRGKW